MTLVESILNRVRSETKSARETAGAELFQILNRESDPKPGDEDRLQACAEVLGIKIEDLTTVLGYARDLASNLAALETEDGFRSMLYEANVARRDLDNWKTQELSRIEREYAQKLAPISGKLGEAQSGLRVADEAKRYKNNIRARWEAVVRGLSYEEVRDELNGLRRA